MYARKDTQTKKHTQVQTIPFAQTLLRHILIVYIIL